MRRLLGRTETFLFAAGIVGAVTGVVLLVRDAPAWLATSPIILGVGLFSSPLSKWVGWVLTGVATVLLVIGLLLR